MQIVSVPMNDQFLSIPRFIYGITDKLIFLLVEILFFSTLKSRGRPLVTVTIANDRLRPDAGTVHENTHAGENGCLEAVTATAPHRREAGR